MSTRIAKKLKSLPASPGVYTFKNKTGDILYVGKAGSLKDRVNSYFRAARDLTPSHSPYKGEGSRPIEFAIDQIKDIETRKTDTVLEAYILEQELIKKFQPKYNAMSKDDKSFCYVVITKEDFPRILIMRKTDIAQIPNEQISKRKRILNTKYQIPYTKIYGPYTSKKQLDITLKILRKIFPYHLRQQKTEKGCLDYQIGLCPGPYDGAISKEDYKKNISGIRMILEGKKKSLTARMKKDMERYSDHQDFENAARIRNQIFALQHIQDVALISIGREQKYLFPTGAMRIEGYDISNISGKYAVGSMVVFDNSNGRLESNKNQYRKFKIKTIEGANDVGAMEEILARRFGNNWPRPDLIILDGGAGHLNVARKVLRNYKIEIPLLAVAKGPTRKKLDFRYFGTIPKISENIIEQVRNEAHRFAIGYHRKLRSKYI